MNRQFQYLLSLFLLVGILSGCAAPSTEKVKSFFQSESVNKSTQAKQTIRKINCEHLKRDLTASWSNREYLCPPEPEESTNTTGEHNE